MKNAQSGRLIVNVYACVRVMGLTGFRNARAREGITRRGPDYAGICIVCVEEAMHINSLKLS